MFEVYEQLTEQTIGSITVTKYYVKLKGWLREAWQLAAKHDQEARKASKLYHDKEALTREFQIQMGDQVLVMTSSLTKKLQDQWSGPYVVEERLNDTTYRAKKETIVWYEWYETLETTTAGYGSQIYPSVDWKDSQTFRLTKNDVPWSQMLERDFKGLKDLNLLFTASIMRKSLYCT